MHVGTKPNPVTNIWPRCARSTPLLLSYHSLQMFETLHQSNVCTKEDRSCEQACRNSFAYYWQRSTRWDPLRQATWQPVLSFHCPVSPQHVWAAHTGENPPVCFSSAWRSWMSDCHCKTTNKEQVNNCVHQNTAITFIWVHASARCWQFQGCFLTLCVPAAAGHHQETFMSR